MVSHSASTSKINGFLRFAISTGDLPSLTFTVVEYDLYKNLDIEETNHASLPRVRKGYVVLSTCLRPGRALGLRPADLLDTLYTNVRA